MTDENRKKLLDLLDEHNRDNIANGYPSLDEMDGWEVADDILMAIGNSRKV